MTQNIQILVPRLNANDTEVFLGNWYVKNGAYILKDTPLTSLETTKGVEELLAPADGYFYSFAEDNNNYEVGSCVAIISPKADLDIAKFKMPDYRPEENEVILTVKAQKLADELGIKKDQLPVGILLKEDDIRQFEKKHVKTTNQEAIDYSSRLREVLQRTSNPNSDILIVGAGTTAKITIETIQAMKKYNIIGIVDGNAFRYDNVLGIPVIGYDDRDTLTALYQAGITIACNSVLSFYDLRIRESVYGKLKKIGFLLPAIVHPRAYVENSACLGNGVFIHANAYIGADCRIGDNSFINTSAVISHDCQIGETVFCAPNSVIAGIVSIGERSVIGMCATVLSCVKLGKEVFVTNGTNVIADAPDGSHLHGAGNTPVREPLTNAMSAS